jgi:hypothetical protein
LFVSVKGKRKRKGKDKKKKKKEEGRKKGLHQIVAVIIRQLFAKNFLDFVRKFLLREHPKEY